jgi:hypothetical protein
LRCTPSGYKGIASDTVEATTRDTQRGIYRMLSGSTPFYLHPSNGVNPAAIVTVKANAHDPPIDLEIQNVPIPSTIDTDARYEYRKAIA